jgi:hypothetical protein
MAVRILVNAGMDAIAATAGEAGVPTAVMGAERSGGILGGLSGFGVPRRVVYVTKEAG